MGKLDEIRPGVLNNEQLKLLADKGIIQNLDTNQIDESSFDLHLGSTGYEMKGTTKPIEGRDYEEILDDDKYVKDRLTLKKPVVLRPGRTYVFKLKEAIYFKNGHYFRGQATGRSSVGRLDVLTRLIGSHCPSYDELPSDFSGVLYLEVTPITFSIMVKQGTALGQLRIFKGNPEDSELTGSVLEYYKDMFSTTTGDNIRKLSLDLIPANVGIEKGGVKASVFLARSNCLKVIDLTKGSNQNRPEDFWVAQVARENTLEIKPERFYIMKSKERFRLPLDVAVYCQAVSETLGELRIHYAGFVHPGFGLKREDKKGTPIIFEVRGHNVRTFLRENEKLAEIRFYRMSKPVNKKFVKSSYQKQELQLSNYFKSWGTKN